MRVTAFFTDASGGSARAEALLLTHYSPYNRQIKVSTSTKRPKVCMSEKYRKQTSDTRFVISRIILIAVNYQDLYLAESSSEKYETEIRNLFSSVFRK